MVSGLVRSTLILASERKVRPALPHALLSAPLSSAYGTDGGECLREATASVRGGTSVVGGRSPQPGEEGHP